MQNDKTDEQLKELFRDVKKHDEARVPSFGGLIHGRESASLPFLTWPRIIAAAALIMICIGVGLTLVGKPRAEFDVDQWAALSNWRAPTDGLLTLSGTSLGSSIDSPSDAWMSYEMETSSETTETQQEKEGVL